MPKVTMQQVLDFLQDDWSRYITGFENLSPQEQTAFLERQGFRRFQDLLAHICAWWEEALKTITAILENYEYLERQYDIDAFNAEAVAQFKDWKEEDVITHFENLRESLLSLVADLPDEALAHPRIAGWLQSDVIEHAEEHKIT
jgi:hypothetical protein